MKYNKIYNGTAEDFAKYTLYLENIKNNIPKSIYDFASDVTRHTFDERSLHDSWLKEIKVETNFEKRISNINLILLGAYQDREFYFYFEGVREYKINQSLQDGFRDLLTFEIGLESNCYDEKQIVFRGEFVDVDNKIEIYCNDMKIEEKTL